MKREGAESNYARNPVEELTGLPDIEAFYQAMAEAYGEDSEYAEKYKIRFLSTPPEESLLFAIRDEKKIIAGVELSFLTRNGERVAYGWNKFVSEEHRGQGLAQDLGRTVEAVARANGCAYIFALVVTNNHEAVRSIELVGYKQATSAEFAYFRDRYPDSTVYIKEL